MTEQDDNDPNIDSTTETTVGLGKGLDVGTANLAAAVQNEEGGITVNVDNDAVRLRKLGANCGGQAEAHCAHAA